MLGRAGDEDMRAVPDSAEEVDRARLVRRSSSVLSGTLLWATALVAARVVFCQRQGESPTTLGGAWCFRLNSVRASGAVASAVDHMRGRPAIRSRARALGRPAH